MLSQQTINELKDQRDYFKSQMEHLDAVIKLAELNLSPLKDSDAVDFSKMTVIPYKGNESWKAKFAAILKQENRFLSINEMAAMVVQYEPKIDLKTAKEKLGTAKNQLLFDKAIIKHKVGSNNLNTFYGSPKWINDDLAILPEHMYDEKALSLKETMEIYRNKKPAPEVRSTIGGF